jgi:DNA-binding CsgD family transcriptional regulator
MRCTGEGRGVLVDGPDSGLEEVQEGGCLVDRAEVEVDDDESVVADGVADGLREHTSQSSSLGKPGEGREPGRQVGDRVLYVEGCHHLTVRSELVVAHPRILGSSIVHAVATARRMRTGALERVENLCREHSGDHALRTALLSEIRRELEFDWYAWLLTDPETEVGSAPVAEIPSMRDLPRLIRAKYTTSLNRWTNLESPVATLQVATGGELQRSRMWQELLREYGVVDVASLVFRDSHGCWGWLDLWRRAESGSFDDGERDYLASIVTPITAGLRGAVARSFDEDSTNPVEADGPIVLVLSPQLEVKAQTPDTEAYLRTLIPPVGDRRAIPAAAYNVAAQVLAIEVGADSHPASARAYLGGGVWLTVRAARVDASTPMAERDIAVAIDVASPAQRRDLFARGYALSRREVEVIDQIAQGGDTRAIAAALFVSEHTIQDHLKSSVASVGSRPV